MVNKIKYTPLNAKRILWTIVPKFIFNIKENKIITKFEDSLFLDKKNNIKGSVISYDVKNNIDKERLIKDINNSTFTIIYSMNETVWKLLMLKDFKTHPKQKMEKVKMIIKNII